MIEVNRIDLIILYKIYVMSMNQYGMNIKSIRLIHLHRQTHNTTIKGNFQHLNTRDKSTQAHHIQISLHIYNLFEFK